MADEQKESTDTDTPAAKEVVLTQDKLDKLINSGFGKGAKKAEQDLIKGLGFSSLDEVKELIKAKQESDEAGKSDLEKAAGNIATLTEALNKAETSNKNLMAEIAIEGVAKQNGVNDTEYFKYLVANASKVDGYDADEFMNKLKTDKPNLFSKTDAKKIDATPSPNSTKIEDRIAAATTIAELRELQKES